MTTCAEAIALALTCTRIRAIHIVVFAGFGAGALSERIRLSGAKIVFASDMTWRKGKDAPLKEIVDEAVAEAGVARRPDELRGEVISALVALRQGYESS